MRSFREAREVWEWHYRNSLAHRLLHPLGLDLHGLHRAWVASMHATGQMWAREIPYAEWMAESARMCARDGATLMPDGAIAPAGGASAMASARGVPSVAPPRAVRSKS